MAAYAGPLDHWRIALRDRRLGARSHRFAGDIHESQGAWGGAPVLLIGVLYFTLVVHDVYGLVIFSAAP